MRRTRAASRASQRPQMAGLWDLFELLDGGLQLAVLAWLSASDMQAFRAACRRARELANSRVREALIDADALVGLGLHARFPNLKKLNIMNEEELTDKKFAVFAVGELEDLPSLVELRVQGCKLLGIGAALAIARACTRLERLYANRTGARPTCHALGSVLASYTLFPSLFPC